MKTKDDLLLDKLVIELVSKNKCHTVLLYGSRARGDFNDQSDYDLLGVRKSGESYRIARKQNGFYIDAFVFPEKDLRTITENHLYMQGAKVLYDRNGFGMQFLKKLEKVSGKKFRPLSKNEINLRRVWLHKMYERVLVADIEGNYRRAWLQESLLVEYFNLRKKRYLGSKQSFQWLKDHDQKTFRLFERVLSHPTDAKLLKRLVEKVSGSPLNG